MEIRYILLLALLCCSSMQARANYLSIIEWGDIGVTGNTCDQMLAGAYSPVVNTYLQSDFSTCVDLSSSSTGQYGNFECYSNGTAHVVFSRNSDCSVNQGEGSLALAVQATTWGNPACWTGNQIPISGAYLRIVCNQGSIPPPGTAPAPQSTPPTSTPVATPTASPTRPPTSSPTSAPISTPAPVSVPSAPSTPVSAPSADNIVGANFWFSVHIGPNCAAAPAASQNMTNNYDVCQTFSGGGASLTTYAACTPANGIPYGDLCATCTQSTCTALPYVSPDTFYWGIPRCISTSSSYSISATCSPIFASPPTIGAPTAPYSPPPVAPTAPTASSNPPTASNQPVAPPASEATIDFSVNFGDSCTPASSVTSGSLADSTSCQTLFSGVAYGVTQCSEQGTPSGKVCTNSGCASGCTDIPATSNTWGQAVCMINDGKAIQFVCNNHTAPVVPVAVVPQAPEIPPVSSGGTLKFVAFADVNCDTQILPVSLVADISKCQSLTAAGSTAFYVKVDCYYNSSLHGAICGSDSTCTTCTPLPQAPSGLCVPYSMQGGLIQAIKATCPVFPPPTVPVAPPVGHASTISPLYFLVALSLLLLFWV